MRSTPKVIIIGAGFGGLSAACYLAKAGFSVTIIEKNKLVGGRANLFKIKGFKFDSGPSWYLMPDVFDKFFADFNKKSSDYYRLKKLSPQYRFYFNDGTTQDISDKLSEISQMFEKYEVGAGQKLNDYVKLATIQYQIGLSEFVYKNYQSLGDFFNKKLLTAGRTFKIFENMDNHVKKYFKNPKLQQMIQYSLVFLGGAPKNTPSLYSLMSHVDYVQGVYYPMGGLYEVVLALEKLAKELGVKIITNQSVNKILVENKKAIGVEVGKKKYLADIVVSNADYAFTETQLLSAEHQTYNEKYWQKKTLSPSAFLIYLGVKNKIPKLLHHDLCLGDWDKHFDQIFKQPSWPDNPSYYVCAPSKTDLSVAPKGQENLFILVPIAPGLKATKVQKQKYADKIIANLEKRLGHQFSKDIIVQQIFSVEDFESMFNAYQGNALGGLAHTLRQTAIFRPNNRSKKVQNLFYTGAGTLPGIGTQMCLISGQLTAERVISNWQKKG